MTRIRVSMPLVALALLVSCMYLGSTNVEAQLRTDFYATTCPLAELTVRSVVTKAVAANRRTGAGLIRLMFHDCFAKGCDASILLDGANSEKTAQPNLSLHGFDVIDQAKAQVEAVCGVGKVSCADIVVMAARDSFFALGGGLLFSVKTGRRDGTVSLASNTGDIPSPLLNADGLVSNFAKKGLSKEQMIILSGAHTVGRAQCGAFTNRLYPTVDPTLDPLFAETLKAVCPQNGDASVLNNLDQLTPEFFDSNYYTNLLINRGLLTSDQTLFTSASTSPSVRTYATVPLLFVLSFPAAFNSMAEIEVLTGTAGQIRTNCRAVNP